LDILWYAPVKFQLLANLPLLLLGLFISTKTLQDGVGMGIIDFFSDLVKVEASSGQMSLGHFKFVHFLGLIRFVLFQLLQRFTDYFVKNDKIIHIVWIEVIIAKTL